MAEMMMMMEIAERMDDNDNDDKPNILKCKKIRIFFSTR